MTARAGLRGRLPRAVALAWFGVAGIAAPRGQTAESRLEFDLEAFPAIAAVEPAPGVEAAWQAFVGESLVALDLRSFRPADLPIDDPVHLVELAFTSAHRAARWDGVVRTVAGPLGRSGFGAWSRGAIGEDGRDLVLVLAGSLESGSYSLTATCRPAPTADGIERIVTFLTSGVRLRDAPPAVGPTDESLEAIWRAVAPPARAKRAPIVDRGATWSLVTSESKTARKAARRDLDATVADVRRRTGTVDDRPPRPPCVAVLLASRKQLRAALGEDDARDAGVHGDQDVLVLDRSARHGAVALDRAVAQVLARRDLRMRRPTLLRDAFLARAAMPDRAWRQALRDALASDLDPLAAWRAGTPDAGRHAALVHDVLLAGLDAGTRTRLRWLVELAPADVDSRRAVESSLVTLGHSWADVLDAWRRARED